MLPTRRATVWFQMTTTEMHVHLSSGLREEMHAKCKKEKAGNSLLMEFEQQTEADCRQGVYALTLAHFVSEDLGVAARSRGREVLLCLPCKLVEQVRYLEYALVILSVSRLLDRETFDRNIVSGPVCKVAAEHLIEKAPRIERLGREHVAHERKQTDCREKRSSAHCRQQTHQSQTPFHNPFKTKFD